MVMTNSHAFIIMSYGYVWDNFEIIVDIFISLNRWDGYV